MRLCLGVVAAAAGLAAAAPPAALAQASLQPDVTCRSGAADCNVPARGLLSQFRSLRGHGDLIGYRMGVAPDVTLLKHWEGIQRLSAGGRRYLAVSRAGGNVSFVIVRMESRDRSGGRLRSNRIGAPSAFTAPPARDHAVVVVYSDPLFDHSGGMQVAGDFLAVGLEAGSRSRVAFWNVADPLRPRRVGTVEHTTGVQGAGTVSLAKLRDGRHLLIVGGHAANDLDFYLSRPGNSLAAPIFDHTASWNERQLVGGDREFGDHQSLNLVAGSDGRLYMIGTHRDGALKTGRDFADLFRLGGTAAAPTIRKLAARHLYCAVPGGGQQCNLDAAGGAYVTPSGGLLLYGTEHDNDGPGGSVKAEEFRPAPHRSTCRRIQNAWVELYDDTGFRDRGVIIDYRDRGRRDYTNYDLVERFEDKASAARWCLPAGWRYRLYEDKRGCGGRTIDLVGSGRPASDRKFGDRSGVVRRFNDDVSCSRWLRPG